MLDLRATLNRAPLSPPGEGPTAVLRRGVRAGHSRSRIAFDFHESVYTLMLAIVNPENVVPHLARNAGVQPARTLSATSSQRNAHFFYCTFVDWPLTQTC